MHVISRNALRKFWAQHPDAQEPLDAWFRQVTKATWQNIIEVREGYRSADSVGTCTVFNIKGSSYRLIAKIFYVDQTLLVRAILTHAEYTKDKWKDDCTS